MWTVIITLLLLVLGIVILMRLPYSPTRAKFNIILEDKFKVTKDASGTFTEVDIERLPAPVQRYFRYCGYIDTPKMSVMQASLADVDFVMSKTRTVRIDYQQLNLVDKPERYALITSSLYGIPFEGLDSYKNGRGSMKGVLGKIIPLFNQQGQVMARSALVTWLAESLLVPNAALQAFVNWEPIDDTKAKAAITWEGISVSGIFTFSAEGELLSFLTADRVAVDMDGRETEANWSAYFRNYGLVNGLLQPKVIQSAWHYRDGDCIYFNQNESTLSIKYQ